MNGIQSRKKKFAISLILFLFLFFLILAGVTVWSYKLGMEELERRSQARLEIYINYLKGVLEKYESLPELLAIDKDLVRALLNPHEKRRIATLNRYLETINRVSNTADTYLMNKDGLTIAASNWNEKRPFIGRNFSYRPYFKQAMKGHLGRYFALGTTSSKRGYYFAYPVRKDKDILGAVAVKIGIDPMEKRWAQSDENFVVSDPDGVIFITTYPEWRYKTFEPLSEEVLQRIQDSQRYPNEAFITLSESATKISDYAEMLTLKGSFDVQPQQMMKLSRFMPQAGWNVHILKDTISLKKKVIIVNIVVGSALIVLYVLTILLNQRQYRIAEMNRLEEEAKRALQRINEQLESRVSDRTQKLTLANKQLKKEILDRKRTEVKLKRTRKELIHAAKLAVLGQMSAGINHELNQPLAAIRSYTDNGKQFLEKGRFEDAMWNMEQITELTDRMANIGIQLKQFSKKSSGQIVTVPIHSVIDGAMEILKPALKKEQVEISINIDPTDLEVKANHVLLQQVIVNLISNGMQAIEKQNNKKIEVECSVCGERVLVSVQDNGKGIDKDTVKKIFEPFYTTKKAGQGLGLGLTISDRIVRDLGGQIQYVSNPKGARFEFFLEKVG